MTDEERAEVINRAYETLDRLEGLENRAAEAAERTNRDALSECPLEKWERLRPPPPPRLSSQSSTVELAQQRAQEWDDWARAIVKQELETERAVLIEGAGQALGEIRQQLRDEIAKQIDQVRADFTLARAHDDGKVLDLPAPPLRKRYDPS